MKFSFFAQLVGVLLIPLALGAISLTQVVVNRQVAALPSYVSQPRPLPQDSTFARSAALATDNLMVAAGTPPAPSVARPQLGIQAGTAAVNAGEAAANSTPNPFQVYLPGIIRQPPRPSETPTQPEPPAVTPASGWPDGLASRTASKLGLHVVRNNDPYIMEFVRRVRPRVM